MPLQDIIIKSLFAQANNAPPYTPEQQAHAAKKLFAAADSYIIEVLDASSPNYPAQNIAGYVSHTKKNFQRSLVTHIEKLKGINQALVKQAASGMMELEATGIKMTVPYAIQHAEALKLLLVPFFAPSVRPVA